ncbi:hypothetical protein V6N12_042058 [Hibiscus sabdariffa]|uniref:Uncharacterized protein n=1 Tax=Hibiscus sabdariffa TaxID=183260 RepID=A0ABR2EF86_9ROSI
MCWLLWKRQCRLLLESEVEVVDDVLNHGNRFVIECSRASAGVRGHRVRTDLMQPWSKPHIGWVADYLTKRGRSLSMDPVTYHLAPEGIDNLVEVEQRGVSETVAMYSRNAPALSDESDGIG